MIVSDDQRILRFRFYELRTKSTHIFQSSLDYQDLWDSVVTEAVQTTTEVVLSALEEPANKDYGGVGADSESWQRWEVGLLAGGVVVGVVVVLGLLR